MTSPLLDFDLGETADAIRETTARLVSADGSLQTPPLSGTILAGITSDSVITLACSCGVEVRENAYSLQQWRDPAASGRLRDVFGCGTAAVVTAIGFVKAPDGDFTVADGGEGRFTADLREQMLDIQRARADDPHGWVHPIL